MIRGPNKPNRSTQHVYFWLPFLQVIECLERSQLENECYLKHAVKAKALVTNGNIRIPQYIHEISFNVYLFFICPNFVPLSSILVRYQIYSSSHMLITHYFKFLKFVLLNEHLFLVCGIGFLVLCYG